MTILTKYSNTLNTQSSEYTTQKEYVNSLNTNNKLSLPDDYRTPFTYKEWIQRNVGIIPGKEYEQYNQYVINWHNNTYTRTDTIDQLKLDYYNLLQELSLSFTNEQDAEWFSQIDLDNNLDLEEAIPVFTKKIKEIAIYFINKREAIKKAKLKYNMVGSTNALSKLFYEYLLKAFTKRDYVLNVPEQSAYNTFPELSSVNNGFQIFIEELYDDTSYFDKNPNVGITNYYDLTSTVITDYYNTINFDLSALDWLYNTGIIPFNTTNPLVWTLNDMLSTYNVTTQDDLPLSAFSDFDSVLLNKYVNEQETKKYIGETRYMLSGGYYELDVRTLTHDFISGNNWFYYPSGEYFGEITDTIYDNIMLSSTTLVNDGAIAGLTYDKADKIFVQQNNTLSGAWLRYSNKYTIDDLMEATIFSNNTTRFKFPYPGYGLSGDGAEWTGHQLSNALPMSRYPTDVVDIYWKTPVVSSIDIISIHDTTLIDDGSYPAQEYNDADKITIRDTQNIDRIHDLTPDEIYKDSFNRAWLYKMLKTDIPISIGQTYINWPLSVYDNKNISLVNVISSQCTSINLSSIDTGNTIIGSRAGYGLYDSDIIYKLDSPDGYPTECAWLSGVDLQTLATSGSTLMYNATGKLQQALTLRCRPGRFESFVWNGSSINIEDTTLKHHEHQTDCPYYTSKHTSIYKTKDKTLDELNTNGIGDWDICTCRAIKYSPLGHIGDLYTDYNKMCDIIFVDTQYPNDFDINTWIGRDNLTYLDSKDFAYFQLTGNNLEPDVGWGNGIWKTGDGSSFRLESGVLYKYLRSNISRNPSDLIQNAVPDLIIKHNYNNIPTQWMKAELNDGIWVKTNNVSPMIINPGDYIVYDKMDSNWYCLTSIGDYGYTTSSEQSAINYDSKWANYDFLSVGLDARYIWPNKLYNNGPNLLASELSAVTWIVKSPSNIISEVVEIDPSTTFTFTVEESGVYSVSAIGYGMYSSETVSILPDLTASNELLVTNISGDYVINTIYNDRLNTTINIPLYGWNYTTNRFDGVSQGGRPFWAKAYDSTTQTKQKATMHWGGGIRTIIDDYTFITQPDLSDMSLSANDYVEYIRKPSIAFTWEQPITFNINEDNKEWCKLIIDVSKTSPLNDYLYNITNEMVVSATTIPSDIYFGNTTPMFVNYWSQSNFTWTQDIITSTNGIPPTGGKWIPPITAIDIEALVPYANLTNRHFPTIASVPYISNLYSTVDVGGYFTPRMLGLGIYIGKGWNNTIDSSVLTMDISARGLSASFIDPISYVGNDRGLTNVDNISPIVNYRTDQSWQKGHITEGYKAGDVIGSNKYKEYIPYQSKYESIGYNTNGIRLQDDEYDPWVGETDNIWSDPTYFPPNFRNEYDITGWYNTRLPENKFIYQWKTDIWGNQYALYKDNNINNVYDKKIAYGELWIRNQESIISPISALFPTYNLYQDSISSVNYTPLDFDIWYDTLMIQTSSHVIIEHINFDYDDNRIYTIADNIHVIDLDSSNGGRYGGHYLFEEEKRVTLSHMVSDANKNIIYPILYTYDIDTITYNVLYDISTNSAINALSALELSVIEEPILTFNKNSKDYCIAFVGYSSKYLGMIITTIKINENNGLKSIDSIIPTL